MEWVIGSLVAVAGLVVLVWRFARERASDPAIQWLVKGELTPNGVGVSLKPVGGEVRDVRFVVDSLFGRIEHPPLASAEWPTETPTLDLQFDVPGIHELAGGMFVILIYRPNTQPRLRFEEWLPVFDSGPADEIYHRQSVRGPIRSWWREFRGARPGPHPAGIRRRRVTGRVERRELRRSLAQESQHS